VHLFEYENRHKNKHDKSARESYHATEYQLPEHSFGGVEEHTENETTVSGERDSTPTPNADSMTPKHVHASEFYLTYGEAVHTFANGATLRFVEQQSDYFLVNDDGEVIAQSGKYVINEKFKGDPLAWAKNRLLVRIKKCSESIANLAEQSQLQLERLSRLEQLLQELK